jgi:hypothetical protein
VPCSYCYCYSYSACMRTAPDRPHCDLTTTHVVRYSPHPEHRHGVTPPVTPQGSQPYRRPSRDGVPWRPAPCRQGTPEPSAREHQASAGCLEEDAPGHRRSGYVGGHLGILEWQVSGLMSRCMFRLHRVSSGHALMEGYVGSVKPGGARAFPVGKHGKVPPLETSVYTLGNEEGRGLRKIGKLRRPRLFGCRRRYRGVSWLRNQPSRCRPL